LLLKALRIGRAPPPARFNSSQLGNSSNKLEKFVKNFQKAYDDLFYPIYDVLADFHYQAKYPKAGYSYFTFRDDYEALCQGDKSRNRSGQLIIIKAVKYQAE